MIGTTERTTLNVIASQLGVRPDDLYNLIQFESKWNPKAKNPYSSARGLIQFVDATAVKLGYKNSLDLVKKNPSILDQLQVVYRYLSWFKPFTGKQSLYMSVFYPAARRWHSGKMFPEYVRKVNPGILTPADYISKIDGKKYGTPVAAIIAGSIIAYLLFFRKG